MVIACKKCHTRFHLDDSRVPAGGVRVRCSRCKHAFFVQPPGGQAEAVEAAAAEALSGEAPGAPQPDLDLRAPPEPAAPEPPAPEIAPPVRAEEPAPVAAPEPEEEESDWEFNLEEPQWNEPSGEDSAPEAPPESDDISFSSGFADDAPSLAEAAPSHDAPLASEADADPLPLEGDTSAHPDFEATGAEPGADSEAVAGGFDADARTELFDASGGALVGDLDESGEPASDEESAPDLADAADEAATELDDLGSPDTWDFLSDQVPSGAEAAPEAASERAPSVGAARVEAPRAAAEPRPRREAATWQPPWPVQLAGWVGVALCLAAGMVATLAAPAVVAARRAEPVALGELRIDDVRARVLENVHVGPIWVVSGTLRNEGPARARSDRAARVEVLDADGSVLATARLGALDEDARLREDPPRQLASSLAAAWPRRSLEPGGALELHAVLSPLAAGAARWRVVEE